MLELSAYGISVRCSVKDLEKLGNLNEKNFTKVITFLKKSSTEFDFKLDKLIDQGGAIKGIDEIRGFIESISGEVER